jgi:hypothetical protein
MTGFEAVHYVCVRYRRAPNLPQEVISLVDAALAMASRERRAA